LGIISLTNQYSIPCYLSLGSSPRHHSRKRKIRSPQRRRDSSAASASLLDAAVSEVDAVSRDDRPWRMRRGALGDDVYNII